ncbi:MAG: hypothetical protein HRF51_06435 [bacterium]|jgi:hypothetical protein
MQRNQANIKEEMMSRWTFIKAVNFVFLAAILFSVPANGQERGVIHATATVLPAIRITGLNDLRFETVVPGVDKSVDKASIGFAGAFEVIGHNSAEVSFDFELPPALLLDSTGFMNVNFSSTDASYDDGSGGGQGTPAGVIDPNGPFTLRLGPTGRLDLWIGGTVHPTITQTGGDYSSEITLTAIYTGN